MLTKLFWKDASERAIKTFAQTFIAIVGVLAPMGSMQLLDINYLPITVVSLVSAGLSVLMSVASAAKAGTETASLVVDSKEFNNAKIYR